MWSSYGCIQLKKLHEMWMGPYPPFILSEYRDLVSTLSYLIDFSWEQGTNKIYENF